MKKTLLALSVTSLLLSSTSAAFAESSFTETNVKGRYEFSFQGEVVGVAAVAATGMMIAHAKGKITEAVRTINVGGVPITETSSCTLNHCCPINSLYLRERSVVRGSETISLCFSIPSSCPSPGGRRNALAWRGR
jgi:hypothetical protein